MHAVLASVYFRNSVNEKVFLANDLVLFPFGFLHLWFVDYGVCYTGMVYLCVSVSVCTCMHYGMLFMVCCNLL